MNNYPMLIKERLDCIIKKMAESPMLFVKNPNKDFTRNRKLSFEAMVKLLLSMGGNSLYNELLEYYGYDVDTASTSAFIQQRDKLLPFAFKFLLHEFTNTFDELKVYKGYRLLAVDGSDLNIVHNPKDADTYFQSTPDSKGFNQLHLNAMYDLCNKLYVDVCVQPARLENEYKALTDIVERSTIQEKAIVITDRGYESYNVFAHIEQKGWNYVIRVKDIGSNGILSCLDLQENRFYPISFRVVRFRLSDNSYETIVTNLDRTTFPPDEIKLLYHMHWGIETSFRELKYAIGLTNFHAKKTAYIIQEIFARLVMYNFCEMITLHVVIKQKPTKHGYQVNFTVAINVCRYFLDAG